MPLPPRSLQLTELSWVDVHEHLSRDRRLIVPVGACEQYGPHLPIGTGTLIAEAVARNLSRDFAVLLAPTLPYGVNLPAERPFAGTAGLHEKTLLRVLNDLLATWEDDGFAEFILITAHRHDPHIEALATVTGTRATIRAVEVLGIDLAHLLDGKNEPEHGGEAVTSLMLYLYPDCVNLDRAEIFHLPPDRATPGARITRVPEGSPGSVGDPTLATAEKGRLIFEHILQKVRTRIFLAPEED